MSDDLVWPDGQKEWLVRTLGPELAARQIEAEEQWMHALLRRLDFWRNAHDPPWEVVLPIEYVVTIGIVRKYLETFTMLARQMQIVKQDEGYRCFVLGDEGYIHLVVAPNQQTLVRTTASDPTMSMQPAARASLGSTMADLCDFIINDFDQMQQQAAQAQVTLDQLRAEQAARAQTTPTPEAPPISTPAKYDVLSVPQDVSDVLDNDPFAVIVNEAHRLIARLWAQGRTREEIGKQIDRRPSTVSGIINDKLRRKYGEELIPDGRTRKKKTDE